MIRTPWPFKHVVGTEEFEDTQRSVYAEPSLKVEGAIGPETHDYGTTAIHLYMRDRGQAEG